MIPEPIRTPAEYQKRILGRIYHDLAPHDPKGVLRYEWANARGAIARFERNTIEIRVLDIQECPAADLAILQFIVAVLRKLSDGSWSDPKSQNRISTAALERIFSRSIREGRRAVIRGAGYLRLFGLEEKSPMSAGELCTYLVEKTAPPRSKWKSTVQHILHNGSLAERLIAATGPQPSRERLRETFLRLAACLEKNCLFK